MEKNTQSRREFLRNTLKLGVGVAAMTAITPVMAMAEETEPEDYKMKPNAAPCQLIKEIDPAAEGYRTFKFTTDGRTCSKSVTFSIAGEEQLLELVSYEGGCDGGTQGISKMAMGRPAAEVAEILMPIMCTLNKSGSSCGMQLALAIKQALARINGTGCPGCEGPTCGNV